MRKPHYSWVVCVLCGFLLFVTIGTVYNGFSIYLPYIREAAGLTATQTSTLVTIRSLTALFAMFTISGYYRVFTPRAGTYLAVLGAAVTYLIFALSKGYFGYCLGVALGGLAYSYGAMVPVSIIIQRWFVAHRGLALGIASTGTGLATVILPPVSTFVVERFSLKAAFGAEAVMILIIGTLIFLLLRNDPKEKGLLPLGVVEELPEETAEAREKKTTGKGSGFSGSVWVLVGGATFILGAVANVGFAHLTLLYDKEGFPTMTVALLISITGFSIAVGKILYGLLTDRVGGNLSTFLTAVVLLIAHALCCLAFNGSVPIAVSAMVLIGLGYPISTLGPSVWAGDMTDPEHYTDALRNLQIMYALGSLVFTSVPGIMADHMGSYVPYYVLCVIFVAVAAGFIVLGYRAAKGKKV